MIRARMQKRRWLVWLCLMTAGLLRAEWLGAQPLQLLTHPLEPYQRPTLSGQASGFSVDVVNCALERIDQKYSLKIQPLSRVLRSFQLAEADGFFLAVENQERNQYGQISEPFYVVRRVLVSREPLEPPFTSNHQHARVGVLRNSALHNWLVSRGFTNIHARDNYHILFEMLERERLDIVAASDGIYQQERMDGHISDEMHLTELDQRALGVYFANRWLAANPGFLERFNPALLECAKGAELSY